MLEVIQGHKTYIVAAILAVVAVAHYMGYLDQQTYDMILVLLGASGTASMAAKINRNNNLPVIIFALFFIGFGSVASAQGATTLQWDYNAPLTEVQTYTQAIVVNGTTVATAPSCTQVNSTLTTCNVAAPNLNATGNTVDISATKNGITARTVITGLTTASSPKNPVNFKVVITVTTTIP